MNRWELFDSVAKKLESQKFDFNISEKGIPFLTVDGDNWKGEGYHDVVEYVENKKNKDGVLRINDWEYWVEPKNNSINKQHTKNEGMACYDYISTKYDSIFDDNLFKKEDMGVMKEINYCDGENILDIGCGTGLFLDYNSSAVDHYFGIDVSVGMLMEMYKKHGFVEARNSRFEDFYLDKKFEKVISLYGAFSYIPMEYLEKVKHYLKDGGEAYIMLYSMNYYPTTYTAMNVEFPREKIEERFLEDWNVNDDGKYIIARYKKQK